MDYKTWEKLSHEMAIEVIISDLTDVMVPADEARKRAEKLLEARNQDALSIEYRMGQALIALEKLKFNILREE